ncbi:MAG: acyl-CoA reductase [Polyangiales bacterium]
MAQLDVTHEVRAQLSTARAHAALGFDRARTIRALRAAATELSRVETPLARGLRVRLQAETELSAPMIEWGLATTLGSLLQSPLDELVRRLPPAPKPNEVVGVVLAGNVFSAALRGLCLPLLAGAVVVAKCKSGDAAFPRALQQALQAADPVIGARLQLLEFSRTDGPAARALCDGVDALSVYGDDKTVRWFAALLPSRARLIPHGHGISAAYVSARQLMAAEDALHAAERLALDAAAYDQSGCLSPHFVAVETGGVFSPREFAALLADNALPKVGQLLPAAAPDVERRAARLQWEGAAAVRGELYAHPEHAVSFEGELPARVSPGGRLVAIHASKDLDALSRLLAPFAAHLKCVGVSGPREVRLAVEKRIATFGTASVCQLGEMQTPSFDAQADGRPAFAGLTAPASP